MILVTFALPFESAAFRRRPIARRVGVLHTGIGVDRTRETLRAEIAARRPELIVSSGFAGALREELPVGTLCGDAVRFATAAAVLATAAEKQEFQRRTGADAVEMEGDAIRGICIEQEIPLVMARVISDGAHDELGLPPALLERLAERPLSALPAAGRILLADSVRRRAFFRMLKNARVAQRTLAGSLEEVLPPLLEKVYPVGR